jgi:hypothetical protein
MPRRRTDMMQLEDVNEQIEQFLDALTELSRRYGVVIAGETVVFLVPTGPESEYEAAYRLDSESRLLFD